MPEELCNERITISRAVVNPPGPTASNMVMGCCSGFLKRYAAHAEAIDTLRMPSLKNSALMKQLRYKAVEQSTLSSPLRILAVVDGRTTDRINGR